MEVTAVGAVHYIVITFQVGTREMKERPKVGKVPNRLGNRSRLWSLVALVFRYCSNSRQQQRRKCCRNFNIGILQQKSQWHLEQR